MGVEVELGTKVVGVDSTGIDIEKADGTRERIEAATKVWAAGVQASELRRHARRRSPTPSSTAPAASRSTPTSPCPGRPEVYVVGDMASLDGLPGVAQVAIQGARYAAKHLKARLDGKPAPEPFRYFDKGSMATISRFSAVASIGKLRFSGFFAWVLWLAIHLVYIIGFKQRITTLLHWVVSFIGRGRSERTVTAQQILARNIIRKMAPEDLPEAAGRRADHVRRAEPTRRVAAAERAG